MGFVLQRYIQAIAAEAFLTQIHILTFTPELQGYLSNISTFTPHGLVQCVSNDVCFVLLQLKFLASYPLGLSACFFYKRVKRNLAIQRHNFQVPNW